MMDKLGENKNLDAYLPDKEVEWSGTNSSLRLMNAVFRPIIQLCEPFRDQNTWAKPIPIQEIITQALIKIAHAIDARFDLQQEQIENMEKKLVKVKQNFDY